MRHWTETTESAEPHLKSCEGCNTQGGGGGAGEGGDGAGSAEITS